MASSTANSVKILEVCQAGAAPSSLSGSTISSAKEFCLPLTFHDLMCLRLPPIELLFFYRLKEPSSSSSQRGVVLARLKESLSQTLVHFLPLAGHLTWPDNTAKPFIVYAPNDTVSVTVAESNADFDHLAGNEIRDANESRSYPAELPSTERTELIMSLQITWFPNKGFCIGLAVHHGVLDGRSVSLFSKAWASSCSNHTGNDESLITLLQAELCPLFDRGIIHDSAGLEPLLLNYWAAGGTASDANSTPQSLKVPSSPELPPELVRATFQLTPEFMNELRESIISHYQQEQEGEAKTAKQLHLSRFVLTFAYLLVCLVKARGGERNRKVVFLFAVDCRRRLDPPIQLNYCGNCVLLRHMVAEAREFMDKNAVAIVAKRLSDIISELEEGSLLQGEKEKVESLIASLGPAKQVIWAAGSTQFEFYKVDFGWGRPAKVEFTSIDNVEFRYIDNANAISVMEGKDGSRDVEIGLALVRHEMEAFASLFVQGLGQVVYG